MGNASSELQHIANALSGLAKDEKAFITAVLEGRPKDAEKELKRNPNVIYARTRDWQNAWHMAALTGSLEMMEVLNKYGSSGTRKPLPGEPLPVNHKTKKGLTPLMVAVQAGHQEAMQLLLALGAAVTDRDQFGNTAIHYAALKGKVKVLEILLAKAEAEGHDSGFMSQNGRFVDLRNEAGLQPLHFAAWGGQVEAAKTLLDYGANLICKSGSDSTAEVTCNGGSTPLHIGVLRNDSVMVNFLLEQYAKRLNKAKATSPNDHERAKFEDPRTQRDNYGATPYGLANSLKRDEVAPIVNPKGLLPAVPEFKRSSNSNKNEGPGWNAVFENDAPKAPAVVLPKLAPPPSTKATPAGPIAAKLPPPPGPAGSAARPSASGAARASAGGMAAASTASATPASAGPAAAASAASPAAGTPSTATTSSGAAPTTAPSPVASTPATSSSATAAPASASAAEAPSSASAAPPLSTSPSQTPAAASATPAQQQQGPPADSAPPSSSAPKPDEPPARFVCPITSGLMMDPVKASDGRSYERSAIEMWFDLGNHEFPGGDTKITSKELAADTELRAEIAAWRLAATSLKAT